MTDTELTALNIKSARYYGPQLQMNHFTEELAELIQAVVDEDPQEIAEEIADVEVMIEQMKVLNDLDPEEIKRGENEGNYAMCSRDPYNDNYIWALAAAIKSVNKLRRALRDTAMNDHISKADAKIQQDDAKKDFEYRIGHTVSCLSQLADKYSIAAGEIREIKSYKVQRTRDRIAHEEENSNS